VWYKIGIPLQEVLMQAHTSRLQHAQLELFHPQSETIHWYKLPREIQQRTVMLLARLLREYSANRPTVTKDGSNE
jgi:hypothetical protein